jgi:hypothetical protein
MKTRGHVCLARIVVCLGVAFSGLSTQQKEVQSAPVLVSHWRLDEGTGTTTSDAAVESRTGTLQNGATWTTGRSGAAVNMDGANDYISLPQIDVTGSAITLSAWVKNASFPTGVEQRFISKASDSTAARTYWMLGQTNNGQNRLMFRVRTGEATATVIASSGTLLLNTWYHAAATYDGATIRLYLNGTQVGSAAKSGLLGRGTNVAVNIGRSPEGSNYLRGAIDDVRVYGSALTAAEISALVGTAVPANQPPSVSLSSPANGSTYPAASAIPVSATASDPDGTIARVEFFAGTQLIGTDTTSPYGMSWANVEAGTYAMKAVAWDAAGASTTSATRSITVSSSAPANQPPTVSLTSPGSGATFTAPALITLSANASDVDGTIARVDFYAGSTLLGTDTSSPYSVAWASVAAGSYSLTAVARDNGGATTVSSTRDITVKPPSLPSTAVFTPSSNHATAVDRYVLEVFPLGAETTVANPVGTQDLGKPAITNGEIRADVSSTILALTPGNYVATITAIGSGGSAQSAPSPQFTR